MRVVQIKLKKKDMADLKVESWYRWEIKRLMPLSAVYLFRIVAILVTHGALNRLMQTTDRD